MEKEKELEPRGKGCGIGWIFFSPGSVFIITTRHDVYVLIEFYEFMYLYSFDSSPFPLPLFTREGERKARRPNKKLSVVNLSPFLFFSFLLMILTLIIWNCDNGEEEEEEGHYSHYYFF